MPMEASNSNSAAKEREMASSIYQLASQLTKTIELSWLTKTTTAFKFSQAPVCSSTNSARTAKSCRNSCIPGRVRLTPNRKFWSLIPEIIASSYSAQTVISFRDFLSMVWTTAATWRAWLHHEVIFVFSNTLLRLIKFFYQVLRFLRMEISSYRISRIID